MLSRRSFFTGLAVAAPAVILTPGLLMPVRTIAATSTLIEFEHRRLRVAIKDGVLTLRKTTDSGPTIPFQQYLDERDIKIERSSTMWIEDLHSHGPGQAFAIDAFHVDLAAIAEGKKHPHWLSCV